MKTMLLVFVLIFTQGCGLIVYEIISSSQFIEDDTEDAPVVNIKYYYDKPDKSKMYPEPKKRSNDHERNNK